MPALDEILQQKLAMLEAKHLRRQLKLTARTDGIYVQRAGKELVSFSCNDYLGLSHHPDVIAAGIEALAEYGAGAGASRLVTGNFALYEKLEKQLAAYKATQAACVFGSGYLANLGTVPALVGKGDLVLADKLVHACMLDAAILSGATVIRFAHNNLDHCRMLLENNRNQHHHCLIMTETVFSMDGDRAPLEALSHLARSADAWLMTDDAHGLGVIGRHVSPADIQMGTLSKGAGVYGGYVCGSSALIDFLKTSARSVIYSTALPPAVIASASAAISIIADDSELVSKPLENARYFTAQLGLEIAQSAIVPIVLKDNDKVLEASNLLEEKGFMVAAIRPPTVPEQTARLRFAFSAQNEKEHIEDVTRIIREQGWV